MKNAVNTTKEFTKSCENSEKACMIGAVVFAQAVSSADWKCSLLLLRLISLQEYSEA